MTKIRETGFSLHLYSKVLHWCMLGNFDISVYCCNTCIAMKLQEDGEIRLTLLLTDAIGQSIVTERVAQFYCWLDHWLWCCLSCTGSWVRHELNWEHDGIWVLHVIFNVFNCPKVRVNRIIPINTGGLYHRLIFESFEMFLKYSFDVVFCFTNL